MDKKLRLCLILTFAIILICIGMMLRTNSRLLVNIDGYSTEDTQELSVGKSSDICFNQVPEDYMAITWDQTKKTFVWKVNQKYVSKDSLHYYKINGVNPNLHPLDHSCVISVKSGNDSISLTSRDIDELLSGYDNENILLRNILQKKDPKTDWLSRDNIKTLINKKKGEWRIIILDNATKLKTSDGKTLGYCTEGNVNTLGGPSNYFKLQFFIVRSNAYCLDKADKKTFSVNGLSYTMKPVIVTTEWGAGHILLHHNDNKIDIRFQKPITYTEQLDTLFRNIDNGVQILSMHQLDGSLPFKGNIYIPQFAKGISQNVLNIYLNNDSILLNKREIKSRWHLLPQFEKYDINCGSTTIHTHAGIISTPFIFSYFWLLIFVYLILFVSYSYITNTKKATGSAGVNIWSTYLPQYYHVIATIALAYCVCKSMIAFKLSYTYPYFEKITGVTVVNTALILLLIFSISLIINHSYLTVPYRRNESGKNRKWFAAIVILFCLALCAGAFRYMDSHYSSAILSSYLPGEKTSFNPLNWAKNDFINDLHRSVPYILFIANIATLLALVFLNLVNINFDLSGIQAKISEKAKTFANRIQQKTDSIRNNRLKAILNYATCVILFELQYALLPCIVIIFISLAPGNFSTAFITLGVVMGYSYTLSSIDFSQKRILVFCEMMVTSFTYLIAAIAFGDKGYLTNYFGFFLTFLLMYFMMLKSKSAYSQNAQERKTEIREQRAIPIIALVAIVCAILLPTFISFVKNPEKVSYDRTDRRISMFAQYNNYLNSGYRYAVSDAEFMTVMMHSMFNTDGSDPLNNDNHALHPSVSTGQSPVVLNDLSLPCAFIGGYGWMAYIPYFGLLAILCFTVLYYSIRPTMKQQDHIYLDMRTQWRILTMFMWFGTTLYLYLSYVGQLPFTGRLNPGFGVDSVGEALETSILLAFMTATTCYYRNKNRNRRN